jgi:hypothetical protein
MIEPIYFARAFKGMTGIHYVTDEHGTPTAVQLDLQEWGELWEDIYDGIIAEQRKDEPLVAWEEVKRQLAEKHGVPN